jgi:hypothetical protein
MTAAIYWTLRQIEHMAPNDDSRRLHAYKQRRFLSFLLARYFQVLYQLRGHFLPIRNALSCGRNDRIQISMYVAPLHLRNSVPSTVFPGYMMGTDNQAIQKVYAP